MSSSSFLVLALGFSVVSYHLQKVTVLLLFLFGFLLFPFLLTVMTRTSKTILNNSKECGHPCLVANLRGNAFSFSPLRMMNLEVLLSVLYSWRSLETTGRIRLKSRDRRLNNIK